MITKIERICWPRTPVIITTFLGLALVLAMAAFGFAHFGFQLRLVVGLLICAPGYICAFTKLFGRKRSGKLPEPEIRLNLEVPAEDREPAAIGL